MSYSKLSVLLLPEQIDALGPSNHHPDSSGFGDRSLSNPSAVLTVRIPNSEMRIQAGCENCRVAMQLSYCEKAVTTIATPLQIHPPEFLPDILIRNNDSHSTACKVMVQS
jgi:hypothetical protein